MTEECTHNRAGAVIHTYTSWTAVPAYFPGNVNVCGCYQNTDVFEAGESNNTTGQINYIVSCFGATPSSYLDSVSMSLRTN